MLPGHGPRVPDAGALVRYYIEHRWERLDQVRAVVAVSGADADQVVETVYADLPHALRPAARLSAQAQLDYLSTHS
jgi:hypothetical protein